MQLSASLFHVPAFARVPDLLRVWRPAIHANLRHESAAIRFHSLRIVLFGVKQGLEYPAECIEKVVALLVDPAEDVSFPVLVLSRRSADWRSLSSISSTPTSIPSFYLASLLPGSPRRATPPLSRVLLPILRAGAFMVFTRCCRAPRRRVSASARKCSTRSWISLSDSTAARMAERMAEQMAEQMAAISRASRSVRDA